MPPATRTRPSGRTVAVCSVRAWVHQPQAAGVGKHLGDLVRGVRAALLPGGPDRTGEQLDERWAVDVEEDGLAFVLDPGEQEPRGPEPGQPPAGSDVPRRLVA